MIRDIRIDDICRTERYYTATLLPCILLHESFAGLRAFLHVLEGKNIHALAVKTGAPVSLGNGEAVDHLELISEMDLARDLRFYSPWLAGLEDIVVAETDSIRPDVVIVADGLLIVVEAKFFHDSVSEDKIRSQILAQRQVIEKILLRFPGYSFDRYCHLFLSAAPAPPADAIGCQGVLNWEDVRQLAEQVLGAQHYVTQRLTRATRMYGLVSKHVTRPAGQSERNYIDKVGLDEIIQKCRQEGNGIVVGYNDGATKLQVATRESLQTRKFKWDRADEPIGRKEPRHWIPGARFLELITTKFADQSEEYPVHSPSL
jgi:hypothetical protein